MSSSDSVIHLQMCKVNECSAGSLEAHAGLRGMNSGRSECGVNHLDYGVCEGVWRIDLEARGGAWVGETPPPFVSCTLGMSGRLEAFKDKTGWRHGGHTGSALQAAASRWRRAACHTAGNTG